MIKTSASTNGHTTLLLTGFGPFPGMPANATARLVPTLAARARLAFQDLHVITDILPTEWATAPARVDALVARHPPDVMLHFGVSAQARGFALEKVGRNVRADMDDACGARPDTTCVTRDGPATLTATLPVAAIAARLRRIGVPAYVSRDAGTYLCNALLYHTLRKAGTRSLAGQCGFIHIPPIPADCTLDIGAGAAASPLSWHDAERGGMEIIAMALQRRLPPVSTMVEQATQAARQS